MASEASTEAEIKEILVMGFDIVDFVLSYESGEASNKYLLEGFAHLVKTGQVYRKQGHYGRSAEALINQGFISPLGEITDKGKALIELENGN